ncbi:MAG: undecaprenyl/decaprenyl-phosphate alpha-N-acetylglucosaminyl 1-phosphate transferase [Flavobacteriales bacterium]|nr:undecaprenyl/decaprenyl-phosphate alpha-N-acetylglucosaminyl 1-phosphate transferase [Flavobacteriales bacterium]
MDIIILGFITSFFVVLLATPSLIKVAKLKHLVDYQNEKRKVHKTSKPTIGGIIIFAGAMFAFCLWFPTEDRNYDLTPELMVTSFNEFKYLLASLLILFFIGVKDDIIGTAPSKKLIGHILVGCILVLMAEVRITSMHGIFGFDELPEWTSIILSLFTYIVLVNAFNLIDGVDGLATGIGLIGAILFGVWFYLAGNVPIALLCASVAGALLAFLIFNFSPAKIFMGDSGSMFIGAIMSVLAIKMIEYQPSTMPEGIANISKPILAMSILVYPLFDTIRVFVLRSIKGVSPFTADQNHIHHRLMKMGMGHRKTAFILYLFSLFIVAINFFLSGQEPTMVFFIIFAVSAIVYHVPFLFKVNTSS